MDSFDLHNAGTTGVVTSPARTAGEGTTLAALEFIVEAVGATPTITYLWEGSFDGSVWYPVAYITDALDTLAVTARTRTTQGRDLSFVSTAQARRYKQYRCRVTANTNVTYSSKLHLD
jgi:hypothetical protein